MSEIIIPSFKETCSKEFLNTLKNYIAKKPNQYFSILQKSIKGGNQDNINFLLSLPNISFKSIHPSKKSYNIFHFLSENNAPTELFFFVEQELKKQKVNIQDFLNQMDNKGNTSFVLLMAQKELNLKSLSFIADKLPDQGIKDTQAQNLVNSFCLLFDKYYGHREKYEFSFIQEVVTILDKINFKISQEIINTSVDFGYYTESLLVDLYNMEGTGLKFISEMLQLSNEHTINNTLKSILNFPLDYNFASHNTGQININKVIQNNEKALKILIEPYLSTPGFPYLSLIRSTIGKSYFEDFLYNPQVLDCIKRDPLILQHLFCDPSFNKYIFSHLYDHKNEGAFLFKNINALLDVLPQDYIQEISLEGKDNFLQLFESDSNLIEGLEPLFSLFLAKGLKYSNSHLICDQLSFIPYFFCSDYTSISEQCMSLLPDTVVEKFEKIKNNRFRIKSEYFKENVFNLTITSFQSIIKYREFEEDSLFNESLFNQLKDLFPLLHDNYDIYSPEGLNQLLNELILEEQKKLINRNYGEHYSYKNSYKNILSIYKELKENYDIEHEVLITNTLDFFLNIAKEDFIINPEHQKFKNEVDCKLKSEFAEMERNSIRKNISSDSQKPTINRKRM